MSNADAAALDQPGALPQAMTREQKKVILASCFGTVFEWYDYFLYATLAPIIAVKFFGQFDEGMRNFFAVLTFAAGFIVRPLGALLFGRFGDLIGRKSVFLVTILIMGISTLAIGLLPGSDQIGAAAPAILVALRILQGLAISGEFGSAVTYTSEHAPRGRRGFYTGWIPASICFSIFFALVVVLVPQAMMSEAAFKDWGWRVPFLLSFFMLIMSVTMRAKLHETPAFLKMKSSGNQSKAPISEAFGNWKNLRAAIVAFAMTAGQTVLGYCGIFYVLFLLNSVLKIDIFTVNMLFLVTTFLGTFACVLACWLSDKIGRKPVMLTGFVLAVLTYFPIFDSVVQLTNPALAQSQSTVHVSVTADPDQCSFLFNPTGAAKPKTPCDQAKSTLGKNSVAFSNIAAAPGTPVTVKINDQVIAEGPNMQADIQAALKAVDYAKVDDPGKLKITGLADMFEGRTIKLLCLLFVLVLYAQMTQGPAAATLVELFPTRIRLTATGLPFQLGTGWIGGLLPATVVAINIAAGNMFAGIWYPIAIATVSFFACLFWLPETKDVDFHA